MLLGAEFQKSGTITADTHDGCAYECSIIFASNRCFRNRLSTVYTVLLPSIRPILETCYPSNVVSYNLLWQTVYE